MNAGLAQLARHHGIGCDDTHAHGRLADASRPALVAVLAAMGVDATSDAAIEAALQAVDAARWRTVLPALIVLPAGQLLPRLLINLPLALAQSELCWRLNEESGGCHRGVWSGRDHQDRTTTTIDGDCYVGAGLEIAVTLPAGYHRFELLQGERLLAACVLAATPGRCYRPPALDEGSKLWGLGIRLESIRSERNWGIGDYTDLRSLTELCARAGCAMLSVGTLHAPSAIAGSDSRVQSVSNRQFRNVLYLDVEALEDFRDCDAARSLVRSAEFQARLNALRERDPVDYAAVAGAKRQVLALLHDHFRCNHLYADTVRGRAFRKFQDECGEGLREHALFEALREHCEREYGASDWRAWPSDYQNPRSAACTAFAAEHARVVEFHGYLQWQAHIQLDAVGRRSFELGLGVGLCEHLSAAADRGGAEVWAHQSLYAASASFSRRGDAGIEAAPELLPPPLPSQLRVEGYASFIACLRANMRHCGALRFEHIQGLAHLYWHPSGELPGNGAYVRYPYADLLGLLALESQRNRCVIIADDWDELPDHLQSAIGAAGIFPALAFCRARRATGEFKTPAEYARQAMICSSMQDLPTLADWWSGNDLALRAKRGQFADPQARARAVVARAQERAQLLLALECEGLLPPETAAHTGTGAETAPAILRAIAIFLGRSAAQLLILQSEDVLGMLDREFLREPIASSVQARRKLPLALEQWASDDRIVQLVRALEPLRGWPGKVRLRHEGSTQAVIPRATYRLQLNQDFTFAHAEALVPYLAALGISHVYCSPYLRARPGSSHGYDITDHGMLNPEIGNRDDFECFVAALKRHGLAQICDVVPNHMGVMGADNTWWMDVLENGPASAYAAFFDIDWNPLDPGLAGKVLVPILADHYGLVLERGELVLTYEPQAGSFAVYFYEHRFPIDPREYPRILERVRGLLGPGALTEEVVANLASLSAAFGHLPARAATTADAIAERNRDKEVHKRRLVRLVREHPPLSEAIERTVSAINGVAGERASFDTLDELLAAQAYRLAFWRIAGDEINYRRFFDINDLAALRMENAAVFEATHRFVLDLAAQGKVQGLRIDHPDGLFHPAEYFRRLQAQYEQLVHNAGGTPRPDPRPLYVVLEKIIAAHERLPEDWPVHGTTGYRFANVVNGVFVDTRAKLRLERTWRAFVGDEAVDLDEAAYRAKHLIMHSALSAELAVLANRLLRIARSDRRTRDFTHNLLRRALAEVVARFPVYRTYVAEGVSLQDRKYIDWAVAQAKRHSAIADASVFEFLRRVLLVRRPTGAGAEVEAEYRRFAASFQQFSAPVMAKGMEDTAFYVYNRLVSLNDVGGDPATFGMTPAAFHGASADRRAKWPHTMLATSTHDNKRSEDVRARIDVISEMPAQWRLAVQRWARTNRSKKRNVAGVPAPSRNDEYLLYQTLIGTFPATALLPEALAQYRDRIECYMLKAVREAKVHSSWINPNQAYEAAVTDFVQALLGRTDGNLFLDDFRSQVGAFIWFGALNSLSMALLKLTSPGVPDIYQGQETIVLSLVDPDNRRAVDFGARRTMLERLQALAAGIEQGRPFECEGLLDTPQDGRAKLWVIWRALHTRARHPDLFELGDYHPVVAIGARAQHVLAYARRLGSRGIVTIAGRLFASLGLEHGVMPLGAMTWADTSVDLSFIPAGSVIRNVLTGERLDASGGSLPLACLCGRFPVALLEFGTSAA